jgi:mannose-1-phosphate guanylyltransferase
MHHILLSGGFGTRLWPLSRKSKPKQYLSLFKGQSLFEMTLLRNQVLCNQVTVIGNTDNLHLSKAVVHNLGNNKVQYIVESTPRNTAPAIAFAAFQVNEEDVLLITPSDHIIEGDNSYQEAVMQAQKLAQEGYLVTFGVQPTHPETGYGYIEYSGNTVQSFREKPDVATAASFLEKGNFLWNSGMFCFKAGVYLAELQKHAPEVYDASLTAWKNSTNGELDLESSLAIPSVSIDYAVMEKSDKIKVVPATFQWSDMGSFEAIYDYLLRNGFNTDANGNMVIGETDKHVSFVGVKNNILVYTEDAILVLDKSFSQDVKKVYDTLAAQQSMLLE